ncbi:hypothetical protein [Brevundimonas sp.]|uniref:hypothetical protein n=1 Tax=Brevundimonas sp. TaxID=1871086 RepID=UPI003BAD2C62
MAAIKIENCGNVQIVGGSISGCDVGIDIGFSDNVSVNGTRFRNTKQAVTAADVTRLVLANLDVDDRDLITAVRADIAAGADIDLIQERFGDRLKGRGIDIDALMDRFGNGAAVISLLLQAFQSAFGAQGG